MTPFDRGDIILISYPVNDELEMHLRPAMVIQSAHASDLGIAVVPIGAEPSARYQSIHLQPGTFEAARCGLVDTGYLIACPEIVVDRSFVIRSIGRCPWQTLGEFLELMRQPLLPVATAEDPAQRPAAQTALAREAVQI
jgi:hypothetical protein